MINIDSIIFSFVGYIKLFHAFLEEKYKLTDIPYNVSGKAFPKNGELTIDGCIVKYLFHGAGCTFFWNKIEISYNIDASSKNQILVGGYGLNKFMESSEILKEAYSFEEMMAILVDCESRGIFMSRKPNDLGSWHVNEVWYDYYKMGKFFSGENKDNIDW